MQVTAQVVVAAGTPEDASRQRVEFDLERRVPPGYALDPGRVLLVEEEPLPELGAVRHVWLGIAVPVSVTRAAAPVCDLPPEQQWVNRRARAVHPVVEVRPLHW